MEKNDKKDMRCLISVYRKDGEQMLDVDIEFPNTDRPAARDVPYLMAVYSKMLDKIAELLAVHWLKAKTLLLSTPAASVLEEAGFKTMPDDYTLDEIEELLPDDLKRDRGVSE